jgi:2-polyprenyl-3-methyl-5-hydroxy-6-metoxy-1,4-benzoquinol methylase
MNIKPSEWYTDDYFYPKFRKYLDQYGVERTYYGPSKDWHGFSLIASFVRNTFPDAKTLHDIGCSAGSFVARASEYGLDCTGVDISRFAITHCLPGASGKLYIADITKDKARRQNDIVTSMDLMEHVYEKDLDYVIKYTLSCMKNNGIYFACIATTRNANEEWSHPDENTPVPQKWQWAAVSGHVHLRPIGYWIKKLEHHGFKTNYDLMARFQLWKESQSDMRGMEAWSISNVYFGNK